MPALLRDPSSLCFGFKAALLLWDRLAVAVARMMQGLFHKDIMRSQILLVDPMCVALGGPSRSS